VNAEYRRLDVRLDAESENYPQCPARPRSLDPFYIVGNLLYKTSWTYSNFLVEYISRLFIVVNNHELNFVAIVIFFSSNIDL